MIETALVYIRTNDEAKKFIGCGTLVEGPFLATCRHVWRDAGGDEHGGVIVEFYRATAKSEAKEALATLASSCSDEVDADIDLVLLDVASIAKGHEALRVIAEPEFETGDGFTHAFLPGVVDAATVEPRGGQDRPVHGKIGRSLSGNGTRAFTATGAEGTYFTRRGSSGSPVAVGEKKLIAGILSLSEDRGSPYREASIVPASTIKRHIDALKLKRAIALVAPEGLLPDSAREGVARQIEVLASDANPDKRAILDRLSAPGAGAESLDEAEAELVVIARGEELAARATAREAAKTWRQIGALRASRNVEGAIDAFRKADELDPGDFNALVELHRLLRWANRTGEAHVLAERLFESVKDGRDRSVACNEVGDVLRARNDLAGALTRYEEGLEIQRRLAAADPSHAERARDVSVSVNKIGDVLRARNDLAGALARYEEGLEIRRRLATADPSHAERARDVFFSLARIGKVQRQKGANAPACAAFAEARGIIAPLAKAAPDHHQRQQDLAWIEARIAEAGCGG